MPGFSNVFTMKIVVSFPQNEEFGLFSMKISCFVLVWKGNCELYCCFIVSVQAR